MVPIVKASASEMHHRGRPLGRHITIGHSASHSGFLWAPRLPPERDTLLPRHDRPPRPSPPRGGYKSYKLSDSHLAGYRILMIMRHWIPRDRRCREESRRLGLLHWRSQGLLPISNWNYVLISPTVVALWWAHLPDVIRARWRGACPVDGPPRFTMLRVIPVWYKRQRLPPIW